MSESLQDYRNYLNSLTKEDFDKIQEEYKDFECDMDIVLYCKSCRENIHKPCQGCKNCVHHCFCEVNK